MDLELRGRVALVQGASKGIGRGVAEALAAEGCDLVLTARHRDPLEQVARDIAGRTGRRVLVHLADSGNIAEMPGIIDFVKSQFGALDIIVANSGGPTPGGIRDLTPAQWVAASTLVLAAPAYLLQLALPLLEKSPSPRFFVITSSSSKTPIPGLTLSNTLRPGVVGLIKSLVEELAPEGVRCHSIAPGRFETDRLQHVIQIQQQRTGSSEEQVRAAMLQSIPAGRLGEPVEIGNLVSFLSSPKADYLNGGNWLVDGGFVRAI